MFIVYILESSKIDKLYIGFSTNTDARLKKHNSGGSRWTRRGIPWKIVYTKTFNTKTEAIKYERFLKNLKNKKLLRNIITAG